MRWSLKTFLVIVPILALLLVFLIHHLFEPTPEATISMIGPMTAGDAILLAPPSEELVRRSIDRHYAVNANVQQVSLLSLIKMKELESWTEDERDFPLIGPAQLHHRLWLCEFDAVSSEGDVTRRFVEIDQNHFHQP